MGTTSSRYYGGSKGSPDFTAELGDASTPVLVLLQHFKDHVVHGDVQDAAHLLADHISMESERKGDGYFPGNDEFLLSAFYMVAHYGNADFFQFPKDIIESANGSRDLRQVPYLSEMLYDMFRDAVREAGNEELMLFV